MYKEGTPFLAAVATVEFVFEFVFLKFLYIICGVI